MDPLDTIFSLLILLSAFLLMAGKRVEAYISSLRIQAALIAAATFAAGIRNIAEGGVSLIVVSLLIIALKVVFIPDRLHRTRASVEYKVEKDFILNIPMLIMICCGIVVLTYFAVAATGSLMGGPRKPLLVQSISVVLIGLFFIISRKKAIGQIVGLLVIENGLFVTALFMTDGLPFIVDMGIFVDLITSVLILGLLVFRINDRFESIDIDRLNELRG